jgi:UDP-galactopyranose mutase
MSHYDYLVVGGGLSGAVIAERLASEGKSILIIDKRDHIGGNCYDYVNEYGILTSKYGVHIFHTNSERVWGYVNLFSKWRRWDHKVLSSVPLNYNENEAVLAPIPVNINTVNILCDTNISTEEEMRQWLDEIQVKFDSPEKNSEETALSRVGHELYLKLFKGYTRKQWEKDPSELNPSVLSRIPIRSNFDDRYFTDKYQALPVNGYTSFITSMVTHKNIEVMLNTSYESLFEGVNKDGRTGRTGNGKCGDFTYGEVIYTGPIDQYFQGDEKLEYRSLRFEETVYQTGGYRQEVAVINYPSIDIPYTRTIEYKHLLHQKSEYTSIVKEYPSSTGEPYYPVPTKRNLELYNMYQEKASKVKDVHFLGRLATYKYYNMDQCILAALEYYEVMIK